MSISVTVNDLNDNEQQHISIPVATEQFFNEFWLPGCESLNLIYVPLFSTGIEVGSDEVQDIIGELGQLKNWATTKHQSPELVQMQERIERVMNELPIIVSNGTKAFIG